VGKVVEFKVVFHEENQSGRGVRLRRATLAGRAGWNHRTFLDRARKERGRAIPFPEGSCRACVRVMKREAVKVEERKKETLWINE
jgi:hypothetical protein